MCEDYELIEKPMLPRYNCPQGLSEDEYLKDLCRDGWRNKLMGSGKIDVQETKDIYTDRIKQEKVGALVRDEGLLLVVWCHIY